jgi:hypothetical protein
MSANKHQDMPGNNREFVEQARLTFDEDGV